MSSLLRRKSTLSDQAGASEMIDELKHLAEKITDADQLSSINQQAQESPMLAKKQAYILMISLSCLFIGIQLRTQEFSYLAFKLTTMVIYLSYLYFNSKALESKL